METNDKAVSVKATNNHVKIMVAEGRVTLEDLHRALDLAIKHVVPKGGCNCGLTGFDVSFLRANPELSKALVQIPNIAGGMFIRG